MHHDDTPQDPALCECGADGEEFDLCPVRICLNCYEEQFGDQPEPEDF